MPVLSSANWIFDILQLADYFERFQVWAIEAPYRATLVTGAVFFAVLLWFAWRVRSFFISVLQSLDAIRGWEALRAAAGFAPVAAVTVFLAAILAAIFVNHVRSMDVPAPDASISAELGRGEDMTLHWLPVDSPPSEQVFYEVQSSKSPTFGSIERAFKTLETVVPLDRSNNHTLYWRVRAVLTGTGQDGHARRGSWSAPRRADLYQTALKRILGTCVLHVVYDPSSTGRSELRYLRSKAEGPAERPGGPKNIGSHKEFQSFLEGVEPAIIRALARKLLKSAQCPEIRVEFIPGQGIALSNGNIFDATNSGRADLGIAMLTYIPEREQKYGIRFAGISYHETGYALVWSRQPEFSPPPGSDRASLLRWLPGATLIVEKETASAMCLEILAKHLRAAAPGEPLFNVEHKDRLFEGYGSLRDSMSRTMVLSDATFAFGWHQKFLQDTEYLPLPEDFFGPNAPDYCKKQQYRMFVRSGEEELRNTLDRVLAEMQATGELARIKEEAKQGFADYAGKQKNKTASIRQQDPRTEP